jgi:hypothetical protein
VLRVDRHQAAKEPPGIRILDRQFDDQALVALKDRAVLEEIVLCGERDAKNRRVEKIEEPPHS